MAAEAVLIMITTSREDWPLAPLLEELREERSLRLAADDVLTLEQGLELIGSLDAPSIALLIGTEAELRPAVDAVRRRRPDMHILAIGMETGTATLSLRDTLAQEIVAVVSSLAERAGGGVAGSRKTPPSGQILRFRTRRSDPKPPEPEPDPRRALVVDSDEPEKALLASMAAAVAWVEEATRGFLAVWGTEAEEPPGFVPSRASLDRWLLRLVGLADAPMDAAHRRFRELMEMLDDPAFAHAPIARVASLLGHHPLALKLFLIALAPELDLKFHRLFGTLHDDFSRRQPSVALACAIVAAATPGATPTDIRVQAASLRHLRRHQLLTGLDEHVASADAPLEVNRQVLDWLLTGHEDRLLGAPEAAAMVDSAGEDAQVLLSNERRRTLRVALTRALAPFGGRGGVDAVVLTGSDPGWLRAEASALAERAIRVAPPPDMGGEALAEGLQAVFIAARLTERQLVIDIRGAPDSFAAAVDPLLSGAGEAPYILTADPAATLLALGERTLAVAILPPPPFAERVSAAAGVMGASAAQDEEGLAETVADRFRLPLDRMANAAVIARAAAADAHRSEPAREDWLNGFRSVAGAGVPSLARVLSPQPCPSPKRFSCLDPVVLPEVQRGLLEGLVEHVALGRQVLEDWGFGERLDARGVAALFSGESGTGKTMAAHAVASELGADLYVVDLAKVVSKYIGETEKQLDLLFDAAAQAGAVLLFDEADALFGRRSEVKDAHDRYANLEVSYLLQRMETFAGLAILTTNHPENIDSAFTRRLRFEVRFPRPDAAARLRIWEQSIPPCQHREEGLEFDFHARRFDLTGGSIRQIALHAAVAAARAGGRIGREDVDQAIRTELMRLGHYGDLAKLEPRAA